jgi:tetratricopeptide (TPR) repeat protein
MASSSLRATPPGRPLAGEVVVFTGKLASLGRQQARALVADLGGTAADQVTARTTMLVVGAAGFGPHHAADRPAGSRKLEKAERINRQRPGRIRILSEEDFCRLSGLPSPSSLARQFYSLREIRARYPLVRDDHLRYLQKWGLVSPALRTNADVYYRFQDLVVIRQAQAQLERGAPFRAVLRGLVAEREGQLAFDFRPARADAQPAKVIALDRHRANGAAAPRAADLPEPNRTLAAKYFLEGAALDEGDEAAQAGAMAAYRKALLLDPDLVPALINLANLHYARDELIEAQALYERAAALDPECFEAHFNLGNIHHDLGRYGQAELAYRRALECNPRYPDAHVYLAVTLEKLGRSADAKPHWRAYQQLAPNGEWVALAREFSD